MIERFEEHERRMRIEEARQRIAAYFRREIVPKEVGVFHNEDDPNEEKT